MKIHITAETTEGPDFESQRVEIELEGFITASETDQAAAACQRIIPVALDMIGTKEHCCEQCPANTAPAICKTA